MSKCGGSVEAGFEPARPVGRSIEILVVLDIGSIGSILHGLYFEFFLTNFEVLTISIT